MEKTITVTGKGWVSMTPDITRVTITNKILLPDYNRAFNTATENNGKFKDCLKMCKIDPNKLRTINFDIDKHFEYEYDKYHNGKQVFKGYMLNQKLRIDLGMDNKLLTKLVQSIGESIKDDIEIEIGYTVKDSRPAELRMLSKAVSDATEKAEVMAKAAFCVLDGVQSIDYSEQHTDVYFQARNIRDNNEAKASSADSLDITPCDLGAGKDVLVTWNIRPMNADELAALKEEKMKKSYDLERFLKAQDNGVLEKAIKEVKAGKKVSHWIWFIFPQLKGFGYSHNSEYYGIDGYGEAEAFYKHPDLRDRLRIVTEELYAHENKTIDQIFNDVDAMKVKSCMTLFWQVTHNLLFKQVLDRFYNGEEDMETVKRLNK